MNSEDGNIYERLQELFGNSPNNVNILQDQIDIDVQMEYFEHPRDFRDEITDEEIISKKDGIFNDDMPEEDKKDLFVQLASVDQIEAYRTIESYVNSEHDMLLDWAKMALQENRMLLESRMLDENMVFISTGLGGKGLNLRYFVVFIAKEGMEISDFQHGMIRSELEYQLPRNGAELESVDRHDKWTSFMCLVPLQEPLKELFYNIIEECNHYGDFLRKNYIITNVKTLDEGEIEAFLQEKLNDF